jgi:hypothetical protein
VLLFADEELLTRGEPFFTCSDVVISHRVSNRLPQQAVERAALGRGERAE